MFSQCYQNQPDVASMKPSIDSNHHLLLETKEPMMCPVSYSLTVHTPTHHPPKGEGWGCTASLIATSRYPFPDTLQGSF